MCSQVILRPLSFLQKLWRIPHLANRFGRHRCLCLSARFLGNSVMHSINCQLFIVADIFASVLLFPSSLCTRLGCLYLLRLAWIFMIAIQ